MRILGIDTATWFGSVAIVEDYFTQGEIGLHTEITHADKLMVAIDFLMKNLHLNPGDIDGFAVAVGPGSFTGIRIGIGTGKGLAMAIGRPLVGISTLHAMAESFLMEGFICPFIDAGRGEVYACCFKRKGNNLWKVSDETVANPIDFLESIRGDPLHIFGTGAERYKKDIERINKGKYRLWLFSNYIATAVSKLGAIMIDQEKASPLKPNYIRRSDAELHREQREGNK